ncbi:MAG: efflux RND transporter periplasmic adaptor subunit [Rikenellaceae bacterium]
MRYHLVTIIVALSSCMGSPSTQQQRITPVKSTIAKSHDYISRDFVGLSTPDMSVNLAFKISGQILELYAVKGEIVERDELLACLDPKDIELELTADRSSFEQAESRLNRITRLLEHEAVSQQDYESAKSDFVRAKSLYRNTQELLVETKMRSPFKAIVENVNVDTYQRVQAGESIVRVVSPTSTTVEFTLPESSLFALLDSTTSFKVRFDAYDKVDFDARIKEYARTSSDASGFPVALTIEPKNGYKISSGMSCIVTMTIRNGVVGAVMLPISAIYAPISGGTYVWVIGTDDIVVKRAVVLGEITGVNDVIIRSGVVSGDRVVVAGVYQLIDGEKVKIIK